MRKMQIDSICSTVSSPISSLPGHENSGRGSALRCYVLIGLAHDFVLMVPAIKTEPLDVSFSLAGKEKKMLAKLSKFTKGQTFSLKKRQPRTILSNNSCHFVNLLTFASGFFFLSLRKIT